ncbi:response regulator transcription factor [Gorillibacterium sp. sgz5001074]|uniref:response regulator transcription factor n=1 Tax=Gorillibacterium sp. sgz5001074 TaxID=3446695 RepID=UPI003F66817B
MELLIVDDEAVIREGIKRTLQNRFPGFRVHLAEGPEQAAALLHDYPIQAVLTDILMPGMTGLELMSVCSPRHPHVKWVVISAYSEFAYAQEAVRLGAKDYLLKPIGKDALIGLVERLVAEVAKEQEQTEEALLLKQNRRFLREAVFQRWVSGLDIGALDIRPFVEAYPAFQLVMVKMDSDKAVHLEHFIIENVMGELIEKYGSGFVTIYNSNSLLGLVMFKEGHAMQQLRDELTRHLARYLRIPFQILHSPVLDDFHRVPKEVQKLREASATHSYTPLEVGSDKAVEVALQYIKARYREELSLEKVASVVYLNPVYFCQLFKQKTGHGFKEYVIQLRMDQAKRMLQDPKLKLAEISERVGYQDMRHFTQLFRKKFGLTPSQYRETLGEG